MKKNGLRAFFIKLFFSAKMAWHGVAAKPLRTFLTVLGIAIGVASVISLMGIGEGARLEVLKQFESLGSNVIVIKAQDPKVEFSPDEAFELKERVSGIKYATPIIKTKAIMRWRRARGEVDILGAGSEYYKVRDYKVITGHFFTEWHVKERAKVAVLGYNLGKSLLNGRSPVGATFTLNNETYRVVGVLSKKGNSQEGLDDLIIIPYTTALKIAEKRTVDEIWIKADSAKSADLAIAQLGRIYRRKLGIDLKAPKINPENQNKEWQGEKGKLPNPESAENPTTPTEKPENNKNTTSDIIAGKELITITNMNNLIEEADKANRVMTLLLAGIASVSLLVGGLGIMNIMLVAVSERISEIGLKRALGAKKSDLLLQFILESVILSLLGAVAGILAGIWGVKIFTTYGLYAVVSINALKVSTFVALGCGLIFGVYPAYLASSVPPVEALRR
ncbi:MAG: ABC transporter permease [Thermovenabulum sp.]